jgi:hypothetical protein
MPRFTRASNLLTNAMRVAGGGGSEGSSGPRGAVFRTPRALARLAFGRASFVEPAAAVRVTIETLHALAPAYPMVCRLAVFSARQRDQREESRSRVAAYNAAVSEECQRLQVIAFDPIIETERRGGSYVLLPDQLHADLATRRLVSVICAEYVVEALATRQPADEGRDSGP